MRMFYLIVGWIALALGLIGVPLPILPTVPFLLIAAWAFGKSSDRLRLKLLNHPVYGPDIQRWQERGAIRRRAKVIAITAMAGSVAISFFLLDIPPIAVAIQATILGLVSLYLLTRPEA